MKRMLLCIIVFAGIIVSCSDKPEIEKLFLKGTIGENNPVKMQLEISKGIVSGVYENKQEYKNHVFINGTRKFNAYILSVSYDMESAGDEETETFNGAMKDNVLTGVMTYKGENSSFTLQQFSFQDEYQTKLSDAYKKGIKDYLEVYTALSAEVISDPVLLESVSDQIAGQDLDFIDEFKKRIYNNETIQLIKNGKSFNYEKALRHIDQYRGTEVCMTGQVTQIVEQKGNSYTLLVNKGANSRLQQWVWDDFPVIIQWEKPDYISKVLVEDFIQCYGTIGDVTSYETYAGGTVESLIFNASHLNVFMTGKDWHFWYD